MDRKRRLGTVTRYVRNGVHERHVDLYSLRDKILDLAEHGQVVLGLDVLGVRGVEARDQATEWGDSDAFADTEHGSVDVCRAGLQGAVCVRDRWRTLKIQLGSE